jgi:alkylation response protein AidB-like acyl-CoA dehydrogenase
VIPRTIFSEEHRIFRAQCRALFEKEFVPCHDRWEREGIVERRAWTLMGEAGLLCTSVPEQCGGLGADKLTAVVMLEELSDLGLIGMALNFAMHSEIVTPYLVKYGTAAQQARWLPALISGERIGALAMTEPGAGSDLQRMRTFARRDGDTYVLNGQKTFISNGQHTDLTIVAAKTDQSEGAKGISLFVVERERAGYSKGRNLEKIGLHSADTSELFFDNVTIPADNLLGGEGQGFKLMMRELPWERLQLASIPAHAVQARRAQDRDPDRQGLRRPMHRLAARSEAGCRDGGDGQVLDHRSAVQGDRRVSAAPWRVRLHARLPDRARLRGRARPAHLWRHQRDHEGNHQPRDLSAGIEPPPRFDPIIIESRR